MRLSKSYSAIHKGSHVNPLRGDTVVELRRPARGQDLLSTMPKQSWHEVRLELKRRGLAILQHLAVGDSVLDFRMRSHPAVVCGRHMRFLSDAPIALSTTW